MAKVDLPEYPDNSESGKALATMAPAEGAGAHKVVSGKVVRKKQWHSLRQQVLS